MVSAAIAHAGTGPGQGAAPASTMGLLRDDLRLIDSAPGRDGSPAWVIHDPVNNRFIRIGWLEFELLSRWSLRDPRLIAVSVRQDTPLRPSLEQVVAFDQFLRAQELVRLTRPEDTALLVQKVARARQSLAQWLLHNYLFFRIPLFRPGPFFQRCLPYLGWAFSPRFWALSILAGLMGLFLVARQWDSFVHTVLNHFSLQGLFAYGLALMLAKTLHECGHAVAATRLGCRVAHMGMAFLVMWPMLYTDTGESWKLSDRRQRFQIAAAGMAVELALACWATLGWAIAPDGAWRDACFFLATVSWVTTLALNASPFMRFDGYFLLSDALDIPNLHARAGELGRVFLRRQVLGSDETYPGDFEPGLKRGLIAFALITWLYRLVVFVGIAVAVYLFFFKLLGILLFAVEIVWFVLRPVWGELKTWPARWPMMAMGRRMILSGLLLFAAFLLVVPLDRAVRASGWLHAERQQVVYSPLSGRLLELGTAGPTRPGSRLAVLDSPDARSRSIQSTIAEQALLQTLDQLVGVAEGPEKRASLLQQIAQQRAEAQAQAAELKRLELTAPFAGLFVDVDPELRVGAWVNPGQAIGVVVDPSSWTIDALVEQADLERVRIGARAKVYLPGRLEKSLEATVQAVDTARPQALPHVMMASDHGGPILATKQGNGQLAPRDALYRVRLALQPEQALQLRSVSTARVVIDGLEQSLIKRWAVSAAGVLIRESGF